MIATDISLSLDRRRAVRRAGVWNWPPVRSGLAATVVAAAVLAAPVAGLAQGHGDHGAAAGQGAVAAAQDAATKHTGILGAAGDIVVRDGVARSTGAAARTGAAYLSISNMGATDDRLVGARSPAADRVELHAHVLADGVARMRAVEGGVVIPAGATVTFERGGLHVMFLGLDGGFDPSRPVEVVLVFERAGEIRLAIPVEASAPGAPRETGG